MHRSSRVAAILIAAAISWLTFSDAQSHAASRIEPERGQLSWGSATINEFHCAPKSGGKFPVVLLLHGCAPLEFGASDFRRMCIGLAEYGFYAMFIEYYGAVGVPNCQSLAMTPSFSLAPETPLPDDTWMREVLAARNSLADNPRTDPSRFGVIGFSFGATLAVITAALNPNEITALVDYYGFSNLKVEEAVGQVASFPPTLILQGDSDSRAHVVDSIHLHNVIAKHQKGTEIHVYPGVEHAFNFHGAFGYDEEASDDAWARTLEFLGRYLK